MLSSVSAHARLWLLSQVHASLSFSIAFQRFFGVFPLVARSLMATLLLRVFQLGASLGNEIWFIVFLPWLFWEMDATVAKQTIFVWCTSYYVIHAVKDLLCLPRPPAAAPCTAHAAALAAARAPPPRALLAAVDACAACVPGVVRLERHYETEYGFPSSHTHNSITMPGMVWLAAAPRWAGAPAALAAPLAAWSVLCIASRLFLGVHSLPDVLGGLAHGVVFLALHARFGGALDAALLRAPLPAVVLVCAAGAAAAAAAYPRPKWPRWTTTPGDTTIILAVTCGVTIACGVVKHAHAASARAPISPPASSAAELALMLGRDVVGFAVLAATRAVGKALCMAVLPRLVPRARDDDEEGDGAAASSRSGGGGDAKPAAADGALKWRAPPPPLALPLGDPAPTEPSPLTRQRSGGSGTTASEPVSPTSAHCDSPVGGAGAGAGAGSGVPGGSPSQPAARKASLTAAAADRRAPPRWLPDAQNYAVELPTKLIVYSLVGFNAVFTVPHLFQALGWKQYGL